MLFPGETITVNDAVRELSLNGYEISASQIRKLEDLSGDMKFAAAVAGYGQLLRGGKYLNGFNFDSVVDLARQGRGKDDHGYRGEFIQLVQLTRSLDL